MSDINPDYKYGMIKIGDTICYKENGHTEQFCVVYEIKDEVYYDIEKPIRALYGLWTTKLKDTIQSQNMDREEPLNPTSNACWGSMKENRVFIIKQAVITNWKKRLSK